MGHGTMGHGRLWKLYLTRIFRVTFREPATRGLGLLNLSGFIIGSFAILLVVGTMNGFYQTIRTAVATFAGDISILSWGPLGPEEAQAFYQKIQDHVGDASSQVFRTLPGLIQAKGGVREGFVEVPWKERSGKMSQSRVSPDVRHCLTDSENPSVVLGKPLLQALNLRPGEWVQLYVMVQDQVKRLTLKVCGSVEFGFYEYDKQAIWVGPQWVDSVSAPWVVGAKIYLPTLDLQALNHKRSQWEAAFLNQASVFTWFSRHQNLFEAIDLERRMIVWIVAFIILVASFNLVSHLYVHYHLRREVFKLLFVLGENPGRILKLCLTQGAWVGLMGSSLGSLAAWVVLTWVPKWVHVSIPMEVYNLDTLPLVFEGWASFWVIVGSMAISILVSLIPALQVRRMLVTFEVRNS
jgi:ABC-type lipoprotein release transport system permease subunit